MLSLSALKSTVEGRLDLAEDLEELDSSLLTRYAIAYELMAVEYAEALLVPAESVQENEMREKAEAASQAVFRVKRAFKLPRDYEKRIYHILNLASVAYAAEQWADIQRWLRIHANDISLPDSPSQKWDSRLLFQLFECWVSLFRKEGREDLNRISKIIIQLQAEQRDYERSFIESAGKSARTAAFRLVAFYQWAKATELLAQYMLQGTPIDIEVRLAEHFKAAQQMALVSNAHELELLLRWLHVAARRMVEGSLWRAVYASSNAAVQALASRLVEWQGRKGMFELLPPQRVAIRDAGLLDAHNHSVVVDLPTSGGKTILAQFRILQALQQHPSRNSWVAYVAPTRALVAQTARRFRSVFSPLGLNVEQLTAAVEIDSFEEILLASTEVGSQVHILVTTPEKLKLIVRNKRITRPLALVVMDEAHNIEGDKRGLGMELLLATIKRTSPRTGFLLLTPALPQASVQKLADWLAEPGTHGKAISLSTTAWQPNERVVGFYKRKKARNHPAVLQFETLTTTRGTIELKGSKHVGADKDLRIFLKDSDKLHDFTAGMADVFGELGRTSVAIAYTKPLAWGMARKIATNNVATEPQYNDIELVCDFLRTEISPDFELIEMLGKGIAVHHAGLSDEARILIEWLVEKGLIRVLCSTTTIAQGVNFPIGSVFLATLSCGGRPPKKLSAREFWNLAGRAGRLDQEGVGIIGIAEGKNAPASEIGRFVNKATAELVSQFTSILEGLRRASEMNLVTLKDEPQWADFRSYIAHLCVEKSNVGDMLDAVLLEIESLLNYTLGYQELRSRGRNDLADALLLAAKEYATEIIGKNQGLENAALAIEAGIAPEGVSPAMNELEQLHQDDFSLLDWLPQQLFNDVSTLLPKLLAIMAKVPEIGDQLNQVFKESTVDPEKIAELSKKWIGGSAIGELADEFFVFGNELSPVWSRTARITNACAGIYGQLASAGAWGLATLTKMKWAELNAAQRKTLGMLPAMMYFGVQTEAAVLMRMNGVPRGIAEKTGALFFDRVRNTTLRTPQLARAFLRELPAEEWNTILPAGSYLVGEEYKRIWAVLSGESF